MNTSGIFVIVDQDSLRFGMFSVPSSENETVFGLYLNIIGIYPLFAGMSIAMRVVVVVSASYI